MTNREFFIQRYTYEHPIFVKICKAVPPDQLEWRPHQKSRSAKELLGHLIGHEHDLIELSNDGVINHRNQVPFTNLAQAVELYSEAHRTLAEKLSTLDEKTWDEKPAKFLADGHLIAEMPYSGLMWMLFFDSIHHRGQLSSYLRPMGGTVPSIYGPSADDGASGH